MFSLLGSGYVRNFSTTLAHMPDTASKCCEFITGSNSGLILNVFDQAIYKEDV
jgi:hypothetical protein